MSEALATGGRLSSVCNQRDKSFANRFDYVDCDGIARLFIGLGIGEARVYYRLMCFVRESLQAPTLKRGYFTDALLRRISDRYYVLVLRRKRKRFFAVLFQSPPILPLHHTIGR